MGKFWESIKCVLRLETVTRWLVLVENSASDFEESYVLGRRAFPFLVSITLIVMSRHLRKIISLQVALGKWSSLSLALPHNWEEIKTVAVLGANARYFISQFLLIFQSGFDCCIKFFADVVYNMNFCIYRPVVLRRTTLLLFHLLFRRNHYLFYIIPFTRTPNGCHA